MSEQITDHAACRIRQRGFRESDMHIVLENGTPSDDGVVLTGKDVAERIAECRARIAELERLRGTAIFFSDGKVVTVYRPKPRKVRRMIRKGGMLIHAKPNSAPGGTRGERRRGAMKQVASRWAAWPQRPQE